VAEHRAQAIAGLYAIADVGLLGAARLPQAVALAIEGGASLIQYRHKPGTAAPLLEEIRSLATLCRHHQVLFIINDDVELAATCGADGVHLGKDDIPIDQARQRLGPEAIVGISCYNQLQRAKVAEDQGADYVAFGSFYPSTTKSQAVRAEPALLRQARRELGLPIVAIGGITPENAPALIEAGADALAVITGVFAAPDIRAAARRYACLFKAGREPQA
jgi:thiamine-phosphate pyrophosphorylase